MECAGTSGISFYTRDGGYIVSSSKYNYYVSIQALVVALKP